MISSNYITLTSSFSFFIIKIKNKKLEREDLNLGSKETKQNKKLN